MARQLYINITRDFLISTRRIGGDYKTVMWSSWSTEVFGNSGELLLGGPAFHRAIHVLLSGNLSPPESSSDKAKAGHRWIELTTKILS